MSPLPKQTTPSKPDHSLRVRENQRRSRARKKEYLSELEAKWRNCATRGVQVSEEILRAARHVVDENARLREENRMLRERVGMEEGSYGEGVRELEGLVERGWECGSGSGEEGSTRDGASEEERSGAEVGGGGGISYDCSSCVALAGLVRAVRPDVGLELEADMGCQEGLECSVSNTKAFALLDEYSERTSGSGK